MTSPKVVVASSLVDSRVWFIFREDGLEIKVNVIGKQMVSERYNLTLKEKNYFKRLLNHDKDRR